MKEEMVEINSVNWLLPPPFTSVDLSEHCDMTDLDESFQLCLSGTRELPECRCFNLAIEILFVSTVFCEWLKAHATAKELLSEVITTTTETTQRLMSRIDNLLF